LARHAERERDPVPRAAGVARGRNCVAKAGLVGADVVCDLCDREELGSLLPADSGRIDALGPLLEVCGGQLDRAAGDPSVRSLPNA